MNDLQGSIHPEALDLVLNSATNASQKGQSQYSTPVELAAELAKDLPNYRPVIVDLTCGPGQLLAGAANKSTEKLLGMDIDPRSKAIANCKFSISNFQSKTSVIHADLTALYESMRQIDFRADCLVLNPPWSLNWRACGKGDSPRLEGLAESEVPAVAKTFKSIFSRSGASDAPRSTIDSTLATLMIALDRLTDNGEGMLIGYSSTLDRLLFESGAPGELLVQHVWKRLKLNDVKQFNNIELPDPLKQSEVIYFSTSHDEGPTEDGKRPRFMRSVSNYSSRQVDTISQWKALKEKAEGERLKAEGKRSIYHLSLLNGQIAVRLGLFDSALVRVNKTLAKTAERLNDLDGRNPMQVVMQRDERNFILGLLKPGADWTVDPALREAVQAAVAQYNSIRAPLVPLPKIQRLGYLDEQDEIACLKDLGPFKSGKSYPLSSKSMHFTRIQMKPNLHGEEEELELSGQELAILITPEARSQKPEARRSADRHIQNSDSCILDSVPKCFMDGNLRAKNVKIGSESGAETVDFTMQELVDHFDIPEVPDIASSDPARYNAFIAQLHQLEQLTA